MVLLYEGLSPECVKYRFTGRIRDNIKVDFDEYIILKNGHKIDPDYSVQEGEVIYMRKVPKGTAVAITMAVIGVVAAVGAGVYSYIQQKKINDMNQKLQDNQKKLQSGSQVNKLPFVRGAANRMATGETFPYIIGETLFTPYKLSPDFIEVRGTDGAELFYYLILDTGFSNLLYKKMFLGNADIKTWSETAPQNGIYSFDSGSYYDDGNLIEIRQTGNFTTPQFNRKISMSQYMEEIPHRHLPDDATPEEAQEIEDEWRAGLVKQLAGKAMSVEVIVLFDGLRRFDSDAGTWYSQSVTLQVQWTNVSNPQESDWHNFTLGFDQNGSYSNVFTRNVQKQLRFSARQDFTAAQAYGKDISIRVRRTTPKAKENARDTVYLLAVQTTCYGAESTDSELVPALPLVGELRDKCSRIGIRIRSSNATDGHLDSFSCIVSGCARVWDSVRHEWSENRVPTRNLAAWVLEIETSDVHAPSRYDDEEFDLDSFGAWYEYCESLGLYADGAITTSSTKKATIDTLVANGNAALVYNEFTGKIEVCIDNGRDYCVGLITPDNILSMNATKQIKRLADGKRVTYINRDGNYETDTITFMRDGGSYDPQSDILSPVSLSYITNFDQAYRHIWRQMAEEIARPMTITAKLGPMGGFYRLFDCLQVQHPALSIGLGHGIIKMLGFNDSGVLTGIELAGWVEFPENEICGIIVNCSATGGVLPIQVRGSGKTNVLEVVTYIHEDDPIVPSLNDTLSFGILNDGEFDYVAEKMLITNIAPANEGCTVTLTPYNEAVYQYGTLPEYHSNITPRPDSTLLKLEDVREYVAPSDVGAAVGSLESGTAEIGNPDNITGLLAIATRDSVQLSWNPLGQGLRNALQYYSVQVSFDGGASWIDTGRSKTNGYNFELSRSGEDYPAYPEASDFASWRFRVKVRSIYNKDSEWTTGIAVNASAAYYGTWNLSVPNVDVKVDGRFVTLSLSQPSRSDGRQQYGNIQYGILIRRPDTDEPDVWWTPGTSGDPVQDVDAYRDITHTPLVRQTPYIQKLPLLKDGDSYIYTLYQYKVVAINEKGYSAEGYTQPVNVIVNFDNIRDFVQAKANLKEEIVTSLSAISASLGEITDGQMNGGSMNYWTLASLLNPVVSENNKDFQGAFRVGGDEEYLLVVPKVALDGHTIVGYSITFKVGKFEISSEYSKLNGEFIVQTDETSLNRTRITPIGTFFEYRDTKESDNWQLVAKQDTGGILSEQVYSNGTLLLSNAGVEARRNESLDIGTPYLSSASRVYHFDTDAIDGQRQLTGDVLDQYGQTGLTVNVASGGVAMEVGSEQGDDFRPAIQVKAPYSEVGNSLYGQFSLSHSLGNGTAWTVDFWFQYNWAEGQEMFRIETGGSATVSIKTEVSEPNYNQMAEGEPPYNTESAETGVGITPYNVARPDGCNLIYERDIKYIFHLDDLGITIEPDDWVHCAVTLNNGKMKVLLSNDEVVQRYLTGEYEYPYIEKEFTGAGAGGSFVYNSTKGTALIDELMIDPTTVESPEDFGNNSINKIPWGALAAGAKRYMLIKDEDAEFISNLNFAPFLELTDEDFEEIL